MPSSSVLKGKYASNKQEERIGKACLVLAGFLVGLLLNLKMEVGRSIDRR
jgi:hypothetical protein